MKGGFGTAAITREARARKDGLEANGGSVAKFVGGERVAGAG